MKQATIIFPDNPERALDRFGEGQEEVPVQSPAVVQEAGGKYLGERGYLRTSSALHIRLAERGSGQKDVIISHDRYLASK